MTKHYFSETNPDQTMYPFALNYTLQKEQEAIKKEQNALNQLKQQKSQKKRKEYIPFHFFSFSCLSKVFFRKTPHTYQKKTYKKKQKNTAKSKSATPLSSTYQHNPKNNTKTTQNRKRKEMNRGNNRNRNTFTIAIFLSFNNLFFTFPNQL